MPHIVIEHSANLRARADIARLVARIHDAALATGIFPLGGLRTRAAERVEYVVADRHPDNAFVHVAMRVGHGRDLAVRQKAAEAVFAALCDELAAAFEAGPLGLSLEMSEIDPALSFKKNNLHDHVERRRAEAAE